MCVVTALAALPAIFTSGATLSGGALAASLVADVGIGLGIASMMQQRNATQYQAEAARNHQIAQNNATEYRAQIQDNNAQIAEIQAADSIQRGQVEETNLRRKLSRTQGAQRAAFAASGVTVDQGSPLDVLQDTVAEGERDALTIQHNAAVEAWGHQVRSGDIQSQASLTRLQKVDPQIPFQTTVLGGKSKLLNQAGGLASSVAGFAI